MTCGEVVTAEWMDIFEDLRDGKIGTCGRVNFDAGRAGGGEDLAGSYGECVNVNRVSCVSGQYLAKCCARLSRVRLTVVDYVGSEILLRLCKVRNESWGASMSYSYHIEYEDCRLLTSRAHASVFKYAGKFGINISKETAKVNGCCFSTLLLAL